MPADTPSLKPWSMLAYTVADDKGTGNALDAPVKEELKAICDAVDFTQLSVAAQVDFKFKPGVFRAALTTMESREFEDIPADEQPLWREIMGRLQRSELRLQKESVDLNAASGNVLTEFLKFGTKECAAERYVFFMYGHASGPMGLFYDRESSRHVPNTMRLNDLADAVRTLNGRAAVMIFRDCFMSNLEAAFELRGAAEFMIASQSVVPITGIWPWQQMLAGLAPADPSPRVATRLADAIGEFINVQENRGPFADAPFSLLDLGAAEAVVAPLKELVEALDLARWDPARCQPCAEAIDKARIGHANDHSRPGDPGLVDVLTMCDNLARLGSDPVVAPAAALREVVGTRLVKAIHTQATNFQGVSLYCKPVTKRDINLSIMQAPDPDEAANDALAYSKLALSRATGWYRIALNPLIA